MTPGAADLPYRLAWRTRSLRVGAHRSSVFGSGGLFRDLTSLMDARDPRRIDLRQSLRDPFEAIHVRRFEQKSAIAVTVLADVSKSMGFAGRSRKFGLVADLSRVISQSALRTGDTFALLAADQDLRRDLAARASRSRSAAAAAVTALATFVPDKSGSDGLLEAVTTIVSRRGLVFLVSDFLMPEETISKVFARLSPHDVVPIALFDSAELDALPDWGLAELADLETGRQRLVMLRPSLKQAWKKRLEQRRDVFRRIARQFARDPFEVVDRIDWDRLGLHLMSGGR